MQPDQPARVTVVSEGFTRMFELNGHGLVEMATVRGELRTEDAAMLTVKLAEFLDEASPRVVVPKAHVVAPKQALPSGKTPGRPPGNRPTWQQIKAVLEEGPQLATDLRIRTGISAKRINDCLSKYRAKGWVVHDNARQGHRLYSLVPGVDDSALTPRPPSRRRPPKGSPRARTSSPYKHGSVATKGPGYLAVYEWMQTLGRPINRDEVHAFLGDVANRQDVNNRIQQLRQHRLIIEHADATISVRPVTPNGPPVEEGGP